MPSFGEDVEELKLIYTAAENFKLYYHFQKEFGSSKKLNTYLLYDPAV